MTRTHVPRVARRETPRITRSPSPHIALVLGGGGMKGFAHLGVLRALRERGITPTLIAGASIGALLGAAFATGSHEEDMIQRALGMRRRELFRLNHVSMLVDRLSATSIYLEEPLRALCAEVLPDLTFAELPIPMLVNTVDIERATEIMWGRPGLDHVSLRDAVYASCALPGFFPPGRVDGRVCVDGGTIDNLPVTIASLGVDAIIAVDVGNAELGHDTSVVTQGFASIFMRSASIMMHALQEHALSHWQGPPMLLVRPSISHIQWLSFNNTQELIDEGYRSAVEALAEYDAMLEAPGGIYPRRRIRLHVDRALCNGCAICVAKAPHMMALDAQRRAYALSHVMEWSPADGEFVRHCPTGAVSVEEQ